MARFAPIILLVMLAVGVYVMKLGMDKAVEKTRPTAAQNLTK